MATYYARADGLVTSANRATATDPSSASTSLSPQGMYETGDLLQPGDILYVSGRGGDYSSAALGANYLRIRSSGADGSPIRVVGIDSPKFTDTAKNTHVLIEDASNVWMFGLTSIGPTTNCFKAQSYNAAMTGNRFVRCAGYRSGNQAFQSESAAGYTVQTEFYDIIGAYCTDDGFSLHDNCEAWVYGALLLNNAQQSIGTIGSSKLHGYGMICRSASATTTKDAVNMSSSAATGHSMDLHDCVLDGRLILKPATVGSRASFSADRCLFLGIASQHTIEAGDTGGSATYNIDTIITSSIFSGVPTAGKAALVFRQKSDGVVYAVEQTTFLSRVIGGGAINSVGAAVRLRNVAISGYSYGVTGAAGTSYDAAGLAIHNCSTAVAGAGYAAPSYISSDPLFREQLLTTLRSHGCDAALQAASPLIGAGSSDLEYATTDYYSLKFGTSHDIGAIGALLTGRAGSPWPRIPTDSWVA